MDEGDVDALEKEAGAFKLVPLLVWDRDDELLELGCWRLPLGSKRKEKN